jgi:ferric-dicitrate binding protein FerR (iron transport regulator)
VNQMKGLILKHLRREELSAAERQELDAWLVQSPENQLLFDEITNPEWVAAVLAKMDALREEEIWNRIKNRTENLRPDEQGEAPIETLYPPARRKIGRYWAAAAVILLLGVGGWLWLERKPDVPAPAAQALAKQDVPPGSNKAILTLSNGQQIVLDSAANGALAQQGSARVIKTDSGQIAYSASNEKPTAILYNTLSTLRAAQFKLKLPDGTKVWLNAASSIRYPVFFTGSDRKVEITGEAYFEVTKDASKPFKVIVDSNQEVDVLGTSFDINAYSDEREIKTTLLEGSVKAEGVILKPGQQAAWSAGQSIKVSSEADLEEAVAWKNGKFIFTGNDIGSVMRQISRWYDVDIEYKGDFQGDEFVGVISRFKNVSEILNMLEQTRTVKFSVEGRKITVLPYKK